MRGVRIPQDLNGEDKFVLGSSVPRLAALLLGLLAAYTILHLTLPAPLQLAAAGMAALTGAAVAWVRPEGRSLTHWALAAVEFKLGQHLALKPESTQGANPKKGMVTDRNVINDRGPRLSVVAYQAQYAPTHEPPPAPPFLFVGEVIKLPLFSCTAPFRSIIDLGAETAEPARV